MGLFGGFKAKFKGKEKKAKRKRDKEEVVCVNFKFFSEFDDGIPSCSRAETGRSPEVVRERRRLTKPQIQGVFTFNTEKATPNTLINGDVNKKTQFEQCSSEAIKTASVSAISVKEEPKKDIAAQSSAKAPNSPTSTLSTISVKEEPLKTPINNLEEDSDDGNFTIHITNHNGDLSDDEESSDDDYSNLSPMDYSSQAASIFFGGEEEPVIMRPRNVMINQDDDLSDGSCASA